MDKLHLVIESKRLELWDNINEKFIYIDKPRIELYLRHNLIAISKWESKWKKPLLHTSLNSDELIDYINCMRVSGPYIELDSLDSSDIDKIKTYMSDTMTATTISKRGGPNRTIYTSEVIYSLMFLCKVPIECEKWHINRLMTLLSVCAEHRSDPKKKSQSEILRENAELNRKRQQQFSKMGVKR